MSTLTPAQLALLDLKAGWPKGQIPGAVAVELWESGGDETATDYDLAGKGYGATMPPGWAAGGGTVDKGLFQVNSSNDAWLRAHGIDTAKLDDPAVNSEAALLLYKAGGWGPWTGDYGQALGGKSWAERVTVGRQALAEAEGGEVKLPAGSASLDLSIPTGIPGVSIPIPGTGSVSNSALGSFFNLGNWWKIALEGVAVVLGIGLIGAGVVGLAKDKAPQAAQAAGASAVLA